ncbi:hypothetical protein V6Z11_A05G150000 [Gossypium hirsutum]
MANMHFNTVTWQYLNGDHHHYHQFLYTTKYLGIRSINLADHAFAIFTRGDYGTKGMTIDSAFCLVTFTFSLFLCY